MRVLILGMGVQGQKRRKIAKNDFIGFVDPYNDNAKYKYYKEVPLPNFDAVIISTPDNVKIELIEYFLENKKHVLVEKPLFSDSSDQLRKLNGIASKNKVMCYTAYNHRFEPHFVNMKNLIETGELGEIYSIRLFYGNGTARLVKESMWRDKGTGVLPDLGSHLLDTLKFWFGDIDGKIKILSSRNFENEAFDHVILYNDSKILIQLEMSLLMWKNHFTADIIAKNGSAHISSLCKWGPSKFTFRKRKLPSGSPEEKTIVLTEPDPTWQLEYEWFTNSCKHPQKYNFGNVINDIWINEVLNQL